MSKPRVFISSTYYDLKHIRDSLKAFILDLGYEPIQFEGGDIPFESKLTLDESCYKKIEDCHMLLLIIGNRYGSPESNTPKELLEKKDIDQMYTKYTSITQKEYETALAKNIPVYVFVLKDVLAEYRTYLTNKENSEIRYAHVDSVNIFTLIEFIYNQKRGNFIKDFDLIGDITSWLKLQWAGIFANYLNQDRINLEIKSAQETLQELKSVTNTLKQYSESILNEISPNKYEQVINDQTISIETSKANRFCSEYLIIYLHKFDINIKPINILKSFYQSSNFVSFIDKFKLQKQVIKQILENTDLLLAESNFQKLKKIYKP